MCMNNWTTYSFRFVYSLLVIYASKEMTSKSSYINYFLWGMLIDQSAIERVKCERPIRS